MSLTDNNPLSFIFGAKPGAGVPTYEQLQMRRKIAESLLGQKSRFPKTFGEGLGAIGEAIGERGMMNRLDAMEQAKGAQDTSVFDAAMGNPPPVSAPPTARPMSYAPEADTAAPVQPIASLGGDPWAARSAAIGGIESGGAKDPYSLLGARTRTGDRAYGKYQVMGANVPEWTQAALGTSMTPQQFLGNKDAQEAVFRNRFGGYVDKYGEEGAAKAWYAGEKGMNNPNATDVHGRLTVRGYGQDYLKRLGPQSGVVDPALNQSVALNQTEPAAPAGPPLAFSGEPASDAPPVGMPIAGQAPPPPDARAAIAGAITPKPAIPSPIPSLPPAPAPVGPQIAQAPPQQQIRVPEREPTPPPAPQATETMRKIERALTTIGDPMKRDVLTKRYQQEWLDQTSTYNQKLEEYKHKRDRWETAPERAAALRKAEQEYIKTSQEMISDGGKPGAAPPGAAVLAGPDPRLGTPASPQRSGVPEFAPPPRGSIPQDWAKSQEKKIVADTANLELAKPALRESLDLIDKARTHPAKDWSIGTGGQLALLTASGRGFAAIMDQLKGQNMVAAYEKVKGTGPVSEKEGENFSKAYARLTTAVSKEDFNSALNDLETTLRGAVERNERKLNRPVTAYQRTPNDPHAPDIGQIDDTWRDGKVREYIGGDPRNKEKSWKIVR